MNNMFLKTQGIRVADSIRLRKDFVPRYEETTEELIQWLGRRSSEDSRLHGNDMEKLRLPVFVKPNDGGSSFGVSKVKEVSQILPAIEKAFSEGNEVIIENCIEGTEVTCGCYKTKSKQVVFPLTEVISDNEFFDYKAKYEGESQEITPARLTDELTAVIQRETLRIYDLIGAKGIIRVDFIINAYNQPIMLEINTNPGMTGTSFIPQQIKAANIDIKDVMSDIVENV
jgi:D-alanine-D-alanine ligase